MPQGAKDIVIVYYFHGYRRCYSCLEAERVARETVQRYFKDEISKGRLRFLSVNVEEPENEHFIYDYQITAQTLVVAKFVNGKQVESRKVDEIWMFPSAEDRANIIRQVVSDFLRVNLGGTAERLSKGGFLSSFLLGVLFALAFCPVSAALFFGALIPLSLHSGSHLLLAAVFGVGTALPVIAVAFSLAFGLQSLFNLLEGVGRVEAIARKITGAVFIAVGFYYTLVYNFQVL